MPKKACASLSLVVRNIAPLRGLLFFGLLLGLATMLHAQPLERSDALLAGLNIPQRSNDYPATLELPESWLPLLQMLSDRSAHSAREVGVCVSLTPSATSSEDLQTVLQDYGRDAARDAPRQDTSGALSARITALLKLPGNALSLTPGALQPGVETHVVTDCEGVTVGTFHTHPLAQHSARELSDLDVYGLVSGGMAFSGVVYGGDTCIELSNGGRPLRELDSDLSLFLDMSYGTLLMHDKSEGNTIGLAQYADDHGGALYCGPIAKKLPRIMPPRFDWSAPAARRLARLQTKAWIITVKLREHPEWPAISFPFTPELSDGFWAYVRAIWPANAAVSFRDLMKLRSNEVALFRAVVAALPATEPVAWSNGFLLPDTRVAGLRPPFYRFNCSEALCEIPKVSVAGREALGPDEPQALYWNNGGLKAFDTVGGKSIAIDAEQTRQHTVLQIKAWVLALKWREHPEWPALDFPFTPVLDDAFWHYLERIYPASAQPSLLDLLAGKKQEQQVLTALVRNMPAKTEIAWSVGVDVPDSDSAHPLPVYQLQCQPDFCALAEIFKNDYFSRVGQNVRAVYFAHGDYYVVDDVNGRPRLLRFDSNGDFYRGDAVLKGKRWEASGTGVIDFPDFRYIGQFAEDELSGKGVIYKRREQAWYRVNADHGKLTFDGGKKIEPPDTSNL